VEAPHTIEILLMRAVLIGLRFRVYAGRPHRTDRVDDIIRSKAAGQNDGVRTSSPSILTTSNPTRLKANLCRFIIHNSGG
jgi:hypothetical protein